MTQDNTELSFENTNNFTELAEVANNIASLDIVSINKSSLF